MRRATFLVDIIYLFVLVLAGEEKCNSGNYYQFTPRENPHLGLCNPRAAPTHQMQSAVCTPSLPSITGCRVQAPMSNVHNQTGLC